MTVTLTRWPSYANLAHILRRYIGFANINSVGKRYRKLSSDRHTYRQRPSKLYFVIYQACQNNKSFVTSSITISDYKQHAYKILKNIYTVSQKNVTSNFCNIFLKCWPILKILSLLDTAMNYQQNKYNISRCLLKTSLHHCVKNNSLKSCI